MGMREDDRVKMIEADAQGLGAEVGRGIDEDVASFVADENGGAQAVVTWIGGGADGAVAADGGYARTGPGAQNLDGEGQRHQAFCVEAVSSLACTKRKRSSVSEFSSRRCSSRSRLPFVFSSRMA